MSVDARPTTIAELRSSGWRSRSVKEELRANLLQRLASGAEVMPGVIGYEETVLPAMENAILAGHDIVFLGERGQAKTRMARLLVGLLDEWLPIVRGGELAALAKRGGRVGPWQHAKSVAADGVE